MKNIRLSSVLLVLSCVLGGGVRADTFSGLQKQWQQPKNPVPLPLRGGAAATRAAWGARPKKEKVTVRTRRPIKNDDSQKDDKQAMNEFLARDSRTTFIGE